MGNYFSYMRISTKEERGKQKYTRQENSLQRYARTKNIDYVFEFKEDVSGKSFTNRSEWNRLEKIIQSGDTVVFKDITRFTREAENGYTKYMELMSKGINLVFEYSRAAEPPVQCGVSHLSRRTEPHCL